MTDRVPRIEPITLEGDHVRLVPLEPGHIEMLSQVALDPRIWEFSRTTLASVADVETYVLKALDGWRAGTALPFATLDRRSGRWIGSTRFENIDLENRHVEIGWTWLNPKWWRTPINTEAKYLMLRHAFENWRCVRVEFKTLKTNERSRVAVMRIGAKEEGTLRRRLLHKDGSFVDAVFYSILDDEWPQVKRRLEGWLHR